LGLMVSIGSMTTPSNRGWLIQHSSLFACGFAVSRKSATLP
jgi:hypothetical protein